MRRRYRKRMKNCKRSAIPPAISRLGGFYIDLWEQQLQEMSSMRAFRASPVFKFFVLALAFPVLLVGLTILLIAAAISMQWGVWLKSEGKGVSKIARAPGYRFSRFLCIFLTKKHVERILKQSLADLQDDHAEALANGEMREARKHIIGFHLRAVASVVLILCLGTVGKILKVLKVFG